MPENYDTLKKDITETLKIAECDLSVMSEEYSNKAKELYEEVTVQDSFEKTYTQLKKECNELIEYYDEMTRNTAEKNGVNKEFSIDISALIDIIAVKDILPIDTIAKVSQSFPVGTLSYSAITEKARSVANSVEVIDEELENDYKEETKNIGIVYGNLEMESELADDEGLDGYDDTEYDIEW